MINGLNSTEPLVKEYAAFVLGAAFSSNPKVQVEAIEGGALQKLLVILATEQPLTAKKKVLFALCSLLRHFPYAQQQFLKLGAAGPQEPGTGQGHRGAGRACGHSAL